MQETDIQNIKDKSLGYVAEDLFYEICKKNDIILEPIYQGKEEINQYYQVLNKVYDMDFFKKNENTYDIARPDFIVLNAKKTVIEVKAYKNYHGKYTIDKSLILKYWNFQKLTKHSVFIAFFEKDGNDIVENSITIINLKDVFKNKNEEFIEKILNNKIVVEIPLEKCTPGLKLLQERVFNYDRKASKMQKKKELIKYMSVLLAESEQKIKTLETENTLLKDAVSVVAKQKKVER